MKQTRIASDESGVYTVVIIIIIDIIDPVPNTSKKQENDALRQKHSSNKADDTNDVTTQPASGQHPTGFRMQLLHRIGSVLLLPGLSFSCCIADDDDAIPTSWPLFPPRVPKREEKGRSKRNKVF